MLTRYDYASNSSHQRVLNGMKAAASRTGKKESYWKRFRQLSSEQNKIIMKKGKKKRKSYSWLLRRGVCAILQCCKKARVSIWSPPSCSNSWRQGFAASSPRHLQKVLTSSWGGKNTFGKSSLTLPATGRRGEKERKKEAVERHV